MEKKTRGNGNPGYFDAGHCATDCDGNRGKDGSIKRLATMTREEARREVLNIHRQRIFSMLDKCLRGGR